jgi:hypothetical protein
MFWSKIWFFLVAAVAAVALTLALVMPRPAERATVNTEQKQLRTACSVASILMRDFARTRVQLAADTARDESGLDAVLAASSKGEIVSGESYSSAKKILTNLDFGMTRKGEEDVPYRPDMVVALDLPGRVVARSGKDENIYGDSLAGYFLIDDALSGYQRDDLWIFNGQLISVAAAPVIVTRTLDYAGAVVIGEAIDTEFTSDVAKRLGVQLTFYANGEAVATSEQVGIDKEIIARAAELADKPPGTDCTLEPLAVTSADKSYWVLPARLPGEAGMLGAFYAVHIPQAQAIGFRGTINAVKKDDLSFSQFPWLKVGILFLVMVGVGIFFTIWENDRPLRRLSKDSVLLAKGDSERLAEEKYRGKFGSIARSINIGIDKLHREARAAKKDLDNLLGPMPEAAAPSPSAIIAAVAPPSDLGFGPAAGSPPPPSAFKFSQNAGIGVAPGAMDLGIPAPPTDDRIPPPPVSLPPVGGKKPAAAAPPPRPKPPVPGGAAPRRTPPPMAAVSAPAGAPTTTPLSIDDDILGGGPAPAGRKTPSPTRSVPVALDDEDEETRVTGRSSNDDAPTVLGGPPPASAVMGGASSGDDGQFRPIYDEFLALKKKCGEAVDNLTYDRFLTKLRSNRDALIAKHGCKAVKFQVYVKDGKAALKASPVR